MTDSPISPLQPRQWLLLLLGLALLWPAVISRDVYAFNDTASYLRGAGTAIKAVAGIEPSGAWQAGDGAGPRQPNDDEKARPAQTSGGLVIYGRSLYFGAFLYLGALLGSLWVPIVIQALLAAVVILALVRHFVDPMQERAFTASFAGLIALATCTSLPFFVCFLMPDLIVAQAFVSAILLLVGWRRETWPWRLALLAIAAFAALSHSSAVAVVAVFAGTGLLMGLWRKANDLKVPAALLLAAALCGFAGEMAVGQVTKHMTGSEPLRPPFLTARLVEDGPGLRYLREHCAGSDFALCRYPLAGETNAEIFLWSARRPEGGFRALPAQDRVRVSQEQLRFALTVFATYPGETTVALARDVLHLMTRVDLEEFRPSYHLANLLAGPLTAPPPGTPLPLPQRLVSAFLAIILAASTVATVWIARNGRGQQRAIVVLVALIVLVNDVICAALSGPFARYNTRIVWALPLVVALYFVWHRSRLTGAKPRSLHAKAGG